MGVVWEAWDATLMRPVAVKGILLRGSTGPDTESELIGRALREARAVARINHPNVIDIHDIVEGEAQIPGGGKSEAEGDVWIVMEILGARNLAQVLRTEGRVPYPRAALIALQVLRGLRAAHAAKVLHRDVKPHNILFRSDGEALLMDFGIATFEGATQVTSGHHIIGTPRYLAPELGQYSAAPVRTASTASDLWSLGVSLFEMVEGRPPFTGSDKRDEQYAAANYPPPPMQHAGPLAPLIKGLLHKHPDYRPSAQEAEDELRRLANDESSAAYQPPVTPSPLPPPPSSPPPRKRSRWWVAACATLVIIPLAGGGWLRWGPERGGEELTEISPTMKNAADIGKLRIGVKDNQPGLTESDDDGTYSGFEIDVILWIAEQLGFDPEKDIAYQEVESYSREYALINKEVHMVIGTYSITDDRSEKVTFAGPYITTTQNILVHKDLGDIKGPPSLPQGAKVCTANGSTSSKELMEKFTGKNFEPVELTRYEDCVTQLLDREVDAVTTDTLILEGFQARHPNELILPSTGFTVESYGIGLWPGDKELRNAICDNITEMIDSENWKEFLTENLRKTTEDGTVPPDLGGCKQRVVPQP